MKEHGCCILKPCRQRKNRIQALRWCLKYNPDSTSAKTALARLQSKTHDQKNHTSENRSFAPDTSKPKPFPKQKSSRFIRPAVLASIIILCITITSINNLLDTPLFAFGAKHRASTYGITNPEAAALVVENHSAYYIDSIILTRHQDGKEFQFEGLSLEDVRVYTIEPGGYDLEVNYKSYEGKLAPTWEFYISSTITSHFNIRKTRAA